MSERVDRQWQQRGLGAYGTAAIFGTLRHYGIEEDEASVRSVCAERFPLEIAQEWQMRWKGTGQFSRFPVVAAEELWRRLQPDRLAPSVLVEALSGLVEALDQMLGDSPSAPVERAFQTVESCRKRVPLREGKPEPRFIGELESGLGPDGVRAIQALGQALAKEGHLDDAEALAAVQAFLFPETSGVLKAQVRAAKGEVEAAAKDLEALTQEPATPATALSALDALMGLDPIGARNSATRVLDRAERAGDFHLAIEAAARLAALLESAQDRPALSELNQRMEKIHEAHAAAHPHH